MNWMKLSKKIEDEELESRINQELMSLQPAKDQKEKQNKAIIIDQLCKRINAKQVEKTTREKGKETDSPFSFRPVNILVQDESPR